MQYPGIEPARKEAVAAVAHIENPLPTIQSHAGGVVDPQDPAGGSQDNIVVPAIICPHSKKGSIAIGNASEVCGYAGGDTTPAGSVG